MFDQLKFSYVLLICVMISESVYSVQNACIRNCNELSKNLCTIWTIYFRRPRNPNAM